MIPKVKAARRALNLLCGSEWAAAFMARLFGSQSCSVALRPATRHLRRCGSGFGQPIREPIKTHRSGTTVVRQNCAIQIAGASDRTCACQTTDPRKPVNNFLTEWNHRVSHKFQARLWRLKGQLAPFVGNHRSLTRVCPIAIADEIEQRFCVLPKCSLDLE
jgi:hypothetical protein